MLSKIKTYAVYALLASSIALGGASLYLKQRNEILRDQLAVKTAQYDKSQENFDLVVTQLEDEIKLRASAEAALTALEGVSDEVYSEELDPSLGRIITDFNNRVRQ